MVNTLARSTLKTLVDGSLWPNARRPCYHWRSNIQHNSPSLKVHIRKAIELLRAISLRQRGRAWQFDFVLEFVRKDSRRTNSSAWIDWLSYLTLCFEQVVWRKRPISIHWPHYSILTTHLTVISPPSKMQYHPLHIINFISRSLHSNSLLTNQAHHLLYHFLILWTITTITRQGKWRVCILLKRRYRPVWLWCCFLNRLLLRY